MSDSKLVLFVKENTVSVGIAIFLLLIIIGTAIYFVARRYQSGSTSAGIQSLTESGVQGVTEMGVQGPMGITGPDGKMGPEGPVGMPGPVGEVGPMGLQGPLGKKGPDGNIGSIGLQGPLGKKGPDGNIGPQGPVGSKGSDGNTGPQGPVGPVGPVGSKGPDGNMGPSGPQGPVGNAGANITMGTNKTATLLNASNGFYFTLPVIGVFTITSVNAPIVNGQSYPQIGVNSGNTPFYSYNPTPVINRGLTFYSGVGSTHGGCWKFQQPGIYEINIYWSTIQSAYGNQYKTIFGYTPILGSINGSTIIAENHWSSPTAAAGTTSSVINTVVNITSDMLINYFFVSELAGIGIGPDLSGIVEIKWVSQN